MKAMQYWINESLAIVSRPWGDERLDGEMIALQEAGIDVLVSMLEEGESVRLGLVDEGDAAQRAGLVFVNFPIHDRGVPADKKLFDEFLEGLERHISGGRRVGVHCYACIGRSTVTIASLLIRSGVPPERAWQEIALRRDCVVPDTVEQREWVDANARPKV
jgi:protein-tyrosine phosphatase